MKKVLLLIVMTAGLRLHVGAQAVTQWFSLTIGNNTCTVDKVSQTPIKLTYLCKNPYGSEGGSYTADPVNGANGVNTFMLRMGSNDTSNASVVCFLAVNAGPTAVTLPGPLGTIPPMSGSYSCAGQGTGLISWP
jgi:hypothetical protein